MLSRTLKSLPDRPASFCMQVMLKLGLTTSADEHRMCNILNGNGLFWLSKCMEICSSFKHHNLTKGHRSIYICCKVATATQMLIIQLELTIAFLKRPLKLRISTPSGSDMCCGCRAWSPGRQPERIRSARHPARALLSAGPAGDDFPGDAASWQVLGNAHPPQSPHPACHKRLQWLGHQIS